MNENKFIEGMYVNTPHTNAPDFIVSNVQFDVPRLIEFLQSANTDENGKLRAVIKLAKAGNQYIVVDEFKPKAASTEIKDERPPKKAVAAPVEDLDDLPF